MWLNKAWPLRVNLCRRGLSNERNTVPFSLDASSLFASLLWGTIGSGMFIFGWKQKSMIPLGGGLLMVGVSYFVANAVLMSLASIAICVGMYWLKKQGY
ncbi:MAG: hypothetical protein JWR26_525 [Pedosphaera sp.]|nr:hypothetical protein [Pedosphaera sp.]